MNEADLTPLMRQYWDIKSSYQDAILFFRVGDFYEMFYKDAEVASQLLSIALTSRDKSRCAVSLTTQQPAILPSCSRPDGQWPSVTRWKTRSSPRVWFAARWFASTRLER